MRCVGSWTALEECQSQKPPRSQLSSWKHSSNMRPAFSICSSVACHQYTAISPVWVLFGVTVVGRRSGFDFVCVWVSWCGRRNLNRRRSFVSGVDLCVCAHQATHHHPTKMTTNDGRIGRRRLRRMPTSQLDTMYICLCRRSSRTQHSGQS